MILFAKLLWFLPFAAVVMVFWFGVLRTAAICSTLLLLYVVAPFVYFAAMSLQHADASIASTWQYMMQVDVLKPLVTIVAVAALCTLVGIALGAVFCFAWSRRQGRLA